MEANVKGAHMTWRNWFSATAVDAAAVGSDRTMEGYAPLRNGKRRDVKSLSARDAPDPPLADEVKRRQVALLIRYVIAIRAR
jgi:hypothetical protein